MVKAVIFDIGGGLMDFQTHALTAAFAENDADARLLHQEFFDAPDWVAMDRGMPEEQVLSAICSRLPLRLQAAAEKLLADWDRYLIPKPETETLAAELHRLGFPLYILSNTSSRFYRFRDRIAPWPLMSGAILSFEEKLQKPDPEIFRRMFSRFGLAPGDCFFIDDSRMNVEAARWCGIQAFQYRDDISQLRRALRQAGVPVAAES